eukprot:scaffold60015_cov63-Phaeocystis_antarctica.AAC.4
MYRGQAAARRDTGGGGVGCWPHHVLPLESERLRRSTGVHRAAPAGGLVAPGGRGQPTVALAARHSQLVVRPPSQRRASRR